MPTQTETALTFEQTTHGAHEITGESFTLTATLRHPGRVTGECPLTFEAVEYDGFFTIHDDGQVTYKPVEGDEYEVGVAGGVEGR